MPLQRITGAPFFLLNPRENPVMVLSKVKARSLMNNLVCYV
uniref:Uncharacterized protein n=1 Tax=Picea sitchensis TaxID=3332 RepID=A0A6B9XS28_PICSI|nr:hypothetical protein Q903MT_gene3800 [Picea sitchensis]